MTMSAAENSSRRSWRSSGIAWMILAQFLFSAMSVLTRLGARDVPWSEVAAARFLIGSLIALGISRWRGSSLVITNEKTAWTRTVFGTLSALAIFYTLSSPLIPLGDAVTLSSTGPIFVALLSWPLIGEKVQLPVLIAVPLAILGVGFVVRPTFETSIGLAIISTAGAVAYAIAMITLRRLGPKESSEAVVLHFSAFGTLVMLVITLPVWVTPAWGTALVLLGVGASAGFGQLAMTRAYSLDRAATISALSYAGIVITHVMAVPIFGDTPTHWQIMGGALVVGAGLIVTFGGRLPYPGWGGARVGPR